MKCEVRRICLYLAIAAGAALLAIGTIVAMQVENWRRDLTTNFATTTEDAADARLRPIEVAEPPAELARRVEQSAAALPNWQLESHQETEDSIALHFVRRTRLLQFADDIRVRIAATASGSQLTAESRSRVGKGDMGQNPRNLRELLGAVRDALKQ